jgi:hypothetical protein
MFGASSNTSLDQQVASQHCVSIRQHVSAYAYCGSIRQHVASKTPRAYAYYITILLTILL